MRRSAVAVIAASAFAALGPSVGWASTAAATIPPVQIVFDDAAHTVTLTIPTPACPTSEPGCKWILFVNEPKVPGKPVIGSLKGTTGVLTVDYPADFCGIIQADARSGPPWAQIYGTFHRVKSSGCAPPDSTTTTLSTAPPITQAPAPPTVSAASVPPAVVASATAPSSSPTTEPTATHASATDGPSSLPFTGADIALLVWLGLSGLVAGLVLLLRRRRGTA